MTLRIPYSIEEHRHRFAGWCAASAAAASGKCRFTVQNGVRLIEKIGLKAVAASWDTIPTPDSFDIAHRRWREQMMIEAAGIIGTGPHKTFTHGVAAKLINCYLKPIFLTGIGADHTSLPLVHLGKVNAIHPPIDRILLAGLINNDVGNNKDVWKYAQTVGWSAFDSNDYERVIEAVRQSTNGELWRIEYYWEGYRSAKLPPVVGAPAQEG